MIKPQREATAEPAPATAAGRWGTKIEVGEMTLSDASRLLRLRHFRSGMPSSVSTFGPLSSIASRSWHALQSCEMVLPSAALWDPSWQRKQPGKSVCPILMAPGDVHLRKDVAVPDRQDLPRRRQLRLGVASRLPDSFPDRISRTP